MRSQNNSAAATIAICVILLPISLFYSHVHNARKRAELLEAARRVEISTQKLNEALRIATYTAGYNDGVHESITLLSAALGDYQFGLGSTNIDAVSHRVALQISDALDQSYHNYTNEKAKTIDLRR